MFTSFSYYYRRIRCKNTCSRNTRCKCFIVLPLAVDLKITFLSNQNVKSKHETNFEYLTSKPVVTWEWKRHRMKSRWMRFFWPQMNCRGQFPITLGVQNLGIEVNFFIRHFIIESFIWVIWSRFRQGYYYLAIARMDPNLSNVVPWLGDAQGICR